MWNAADRNARERGDVERVEREIVVDARGTEMLPAVQTEPSGPATVRIGGRKVKTIEVAGGTSFDHIFGLIRQAGFTDARVRTFDAAGVPIEITMANAPAKFEPGRTYEILPYDRPGAEGDDGKSEHHSLSDLIISPGGMILAVLAAVIAFVLKDANPPYSGITAAGAALLFLVAGFASYYKSANRHNNAPRS